jgi:hypothetical protein
MRIGIVLMLMLIRIWIWIWFGINMGIRIRIRIGIKTMPIHNTGYCPLTKSIAAAILVFFTWPGFFGGLGGAGFRSGAVSGTKDFTNISFRDLTGVRLPGEEIGRSAGHARPLLVSS